MMMTTWTPAEQKEHRKLWVEALRSGKYQQAKYKLRNASGTSFCCLGVACDLSGLGGWAAQSYYIGEDSTMFGVLSQPVMDWLGLASAQGERKVGAPLSELNDAGEGFAAIADIIEAEPAGLIATPVEA